MEASENVTVVNSFLYLFLIQSLFKLGGNSEEVYLGTNARNRSARHSIVPEKGPEFACVSITSVFEAGADKPCNYCRVICQKE